MSDELILLQEKTKTLTISEFRYNHNHGKDGRFTAGSGGGSGGGSGSGSGGGSESAAEAVRSSTENVRKNLMSNEHSPIPKEAINMAEVKRRGDLTDEEAEECVRIAETIFSEASAKEPIITDDVVSSVSEVGGEMCRLKNRLKQPTSLAGKIGADAKQDNASFAEASAEEKSVFFAEAGAKLKDTVRYTAVIEDADFTEGYRGIKASLERKGYREVRCKNFWEKYYSTGYDRSEQKAVQCVYEDKSGFKFELQFHTPTSQGAKELNHPLYNKRREETTSADTKKALTAQMREYGAHVPDPKGVMTIKAHG